MSQQTYLQQSAFSSWDGPIKVAEYDRTPTLSEVERRELERILSRPHGQIRKPTKLTLDRLVHPIYAVLDSVHVSLERRDDILRVLLIEMWQSDSSFWAWNMEDWREKIRTRRKPLLLSEGGKRGHWARSVLPLVAYLLNVPFEGASLLEYIDPQPTACKVFGKRMCPYSSSWPESRCANRR